MLFACETAVLIDKLQNTADKDPYLPDECHKNIL